MDRDKLGQLSLEALRTLGAENGIKGAGEMEQKALIDRLVTAMPRGTASVAAQTVSESPTRQRRATPSPEAAKPAPARTTTSPVSTRPSEVSTRPSEVSTRPSEVSAITEKSKSRAEKSTPGLGVPSSIVHPAHVDEAPREPMGMLDLEELPETYGVDECEVLYRDPFTVFVYWEVTPGGLDGARAQLGPSAGSARLVLRQFASTDSDREVCDLDLTWNHGRRYLPAPRSGIHLRVAVGLLSQEGYFAPIAHSSVIRVPPAEPIHAPVEWLEVVPGRSAGKIREPLVIVQRGQAHRERSDFPEGAMKPAVNERESSPWRYSAPGTSPTRNPSGGL